MLGWVLPPRWWALGGRGRKGVRLFSACHFGRCSSALTVSLSYPQRLYRAGDAESLHRYTPIPDHPDFTRARLNAQCLSDVSEAAVHVVCKCICKCIHTRAGCYSLGKKKSQEGGPGMGRTRDRE